MAASLLAHVFAIFITPHSFVLTTTLQAMDRSRFNAVKQLGVVGGRFTMQGAWDDGATARNTVRTSAYLLECGSWSVVT